VSLSAVAPGGAQKKIQRRARADVIAHEVVAESGGGHVALSSQVMRGRVAMTERGRKITDFAAFAAVLGALLPVGVWDNERTIRRHLDGTTPAPWWIDPVWTWQCDDDELGEILERRGQAVPMHDLRTTRMPSEMSVRQVRQHLRHPLSPACGTRTCVWSMTDAHRRSHGTPDIRDDCESSLS
jgi:hypothetical protein